MFTSSKDLGGAVNTRAPRADSLALPHVVHGGFDAHHVRVCSRRTSEQMHAEHGEHAARREQVLLLPGYLRIVQEIHVDAPELGVVDRYQRRLQQGERGGRRRRCCCCCCHH